MQARVSWCRKVFAVFALAVFAAVVSARTSSQSSQTSQTSQTASPTRHIRGQDEPTKAELLRGTYGPYRANNDLLFYHLDIRIDPTKKLVTPRVIASIIMLFVLTVIGDLVGLGGGWTVARFVLGLDSRQYWDTAWQSLQFADVFMGLIKPLLFGFIVASIGCYYGLSAKGGTQGVGRATTQAVVAADVLIVIVDFFVTKFLMALMHVH